MTRQRGTIVMDSGDSVPFSLSATEVAALEQEAAEARMLTGLPEQSYTYLDELAAGALHKGIALLIEKQEEKGGRWKWEKHAHICRQRSRQP